MRKQEATLTSRRCIREVHEDTSSLCGEKVICRPCYFHENFRQRDTSSADRTRRRMSLCRHSVWLRSKKLFHCDLLEHQYAPDGNDDVMQHPLLVRPYLLDSPGRRQAASGTFTSASTPANKDGLLQRLVSISRTLTVTAWSRSQHHHEVQIRLL